MGFFGQSGGSWNILTPSGEVIGRMTTGGAASYYLKDHLGSVRAVVNSSGAVLETRDYYPYGLEMPGRSYLSGTKAKENFTGHELDDETGLIYAGARYYMPAVGRWTTVDPLAGKYPAWSPYNYVMGNPLALVDPDGKAAVPVIPWALRGAWSAYRAYRAGQAAAATASTVVAAHMTAEVLREGMSQVEVGVGAPPISGVDTPPLIVTTTDKTRVDIPSVTTLDSAQIDNLSLVTSTSLGQVAAAIAGGHAYDKHVIERGEYPSISDQAGFAGLIESAMGAAIEAGATKSLSGGRTAYWDGNTGTVVIHNPNAADGGTAFRPTRGQEYFDNLR